MTKSKIFLYLCLSFILGVLIDSIVNIPQLFCWGFLVLGILLMAVFWQKKKVVVVGFCLLVLVAGITRHSSSTIILSETKDPVETVFQGIVIKEPEIRIDQVKLTVENKQLGKILVTIGLSPQYEYGDKLEIKGKLQIPPEFDDFNYQGYLAKEGIVYTSYYPEINCLAKNQGNFLYAKILSFKAQLRQVIHQTLSPPQSAILGAVLLGDKQRISEELKEKLNSTGTRHIVAISGMHMIILSEILLFLGLGLGLWRQHIFYFVGTLLFCYIIMIGAPASAIRAGIVAGLLLLAQKVGRLRSAPRAITFAATGMLAINPLLLKFDVGFQLSFVAALSIIYLKPFFDSKVQKIPNPLGLRNILTMTLSAQLGTLPLLIYHFGRFSLVSPIANVLIIPWLPFIMGSGLILCLSGLIWLPLAKILSWPVWLLLSYIVKIVDLLS